MDRTAFRRAGREIVLTTQDFHPAAANLLGMRKLLITLLLLSTAPVHASPSWVVYAHRGGAGLGPENTLGLFRSTIARFGAEHVALEMDTQLDASGDLVIIHDDTLDRTSRNCTGTVLSKTTEQLAACDMSKGWDGWGPESLPLTRYLLVEAKAGSWRLMIELKNIPGEANFDPSGTQSAAALVKLVRETGFPVRDLLIQSFFPTSLDYIELNAPEISTLLLTTSQLPGAPPGAGFTLSENAAYATARGYEVCAPDDATIDLDSDTVGVAHTAGRKVIPWTIDAAARMRELKLLDLDGIITNRPDLALAV